MNLILTLHYIAYFAVFIVIAFAALVALSKVKRFNEFIMTKILLPIFFKKIKLSGSYVDNLNRMKKWYNEEMQRDVFVMDIRQKRDKFVFVQPQTSTGDKKADTIIHEEAFREQYRRWERGGRKNYHTTIWYIENNFITRLIGCRPTMENVRLTA